MMLSTALALLLTSTLALAAPAPLTVRAAQISAYYVPSDVLLTFTFTPAFYSGITQQYISVGVTNSAGTFFQLATGLTSPDTSTSGQYLTTPQANITATFDFLATGMCGSLTLSVTDNLIAGGSFPVGSQSLSVPCPTGTPHSETAKGHGAITSPASGASVQGAEPASFAYTPQGVNTRSVDIVATDAGSGAVTMFAHGLAKPQGSPSSAAISGLFIPLAAGCTGNAKTVAFTEHRIENDGSLTSYTTSESITLTSC